MKVSSAQVMPCPVKKGAVNVVIFMQRPRVDVLGNQSGQAAIICDIVQSYLDGVVPLREVSLLLLLLLRHKLGFLG